MYNNDTAKLGPGLLTTGSGGIDRNSDLNLPVQIYTDNNGTKYTLSFSPNGMCYLYNHTTQVDEFALPLGNTKGLVYIQDSSTIQRTAIETVNGNTVYRLEVEADGTVLLWMSTDLRASWTPIKCLSDNLRDYREVVCTNPNVLSLPPVSITAVDLVAQGVDINQLTQTHRCTGMIEFNVPDPAIRILNATPTRLTVYNTYSAAVPFNAHYAWVKSGWVSAL